MTASVSKTKLSILYKKHWIKKSVDMLPKNVFENKSFDMKNIRPRKQNYDTKKYLIKKSNDMTTKMFCKQTCQWDTKNIWSRNYR